MNRFLAVAFVTLAAVISGSPSSLHVQGAGRDDYVAFGDAADEAFHNLRGWGRLNPALLPEGTDVHRRSRYQALRGSNSVDLFISAADIPYLLTFRTEDGICDDSFEIYVNGQGPQYRYPHRSRPERFPVHSVDLDRGVINTDVVTVTFRNVARDSCGLAAVYFVKLEPGRTITTARVKGVVDGDTLVLVDDSQLRLIGVDTPEIQPLDRRKDKDSWCVDEQAVWPMGGEAKDFADEWLGHPSSQKPSDVTIEIREAQRFDRLNRLLAYVYRTNAPRDIGGSLSGELIQSGYSRAFLRDYGAIQDFRNIRPDDARLLTQLEERALTLNQGFWGPYKPRYLTTWPGLSGSWPTRCAKGLL